MFLTLAQAGQALLLVEERDDQRIAAIQTAEAAPIVHLQPALRPTTTPRRVLTSQSRVFDRVRGDGHTPTAQQEWHHSWYPGGILRDCSMHPSSLAAVATHLTVVMARPRTAEATHPRQPPPTLRRTTFPDSCCVSAPLACLRVTVVFESKRWVGHLKSARLYSFPSMVGRGFNTVRRLWCERLGSELLMLTSTTSESCHCFFPLRSRCALCSSSGRRPDKHAL